MQLVGDSDPRREKTTQFRLLGMDLIYNLQKLSEKHPKNFEQIWAFQLLKQMIMVRNSN